MSIKKIKSFYTKVVNRIVFTTSEREKLYTHFAQEFSADNTIKDAQENYLLLTHRAKKKALHRILTGVFRKHHAGMSLGQAFGTAIPSDERALLDAGSQSGSLPEILELLQQITIGKKQSGLGPLLLLLYPFLTIAMAFRGWSTLGETLSVMEQTTLNGHEFTGYAGVLSYYYKHQAIISLTLVLGLLGVVCGFSYSLPNWKGKTRTKVDGTYPYSIYREYHSAQFLVTYAALRMGGISDQNALSNIAAHSSPWLRLRIITILRMMEKRGIPFGEAAVQAGFNVPDMEQTVIISSMKNTEKFGAQLMGLASRAQTESLAKLRVTLSGLFFLLLAVGAFLQFVMPLATQEIQSQIEEHRTTF